MHVVLHGLRVSPGKNEEKNKRVFCLGALAGRNQDAKMAARQKYKAAELGQLRPGGTRLREFCASRRLEAGQDLLGEGFFQRLFLVERRASVDGDLERDIALLDDEADIAPYGQVVGIIAEAGDGCDDDRLYRRRLACLQRVGILN